METKFTFDELIRKLEDVLKPQYMNDVFTWNRIERALAKDVYERPVTVPINNNGYKIVIDGRHYTHPHERITGCELLTYRGILNEDGRHQVFQINEEKGDDEMIRDNQQVELSGINKFYTIVAR